MSEHQPRYPCEVVIYDEVAQMLAPFYLPPAGTHVKTEELLRALKRLNAATVALKHNKTGPPQ